MRNTEVLALLGGLATVQPQSTDDATVRVWREALDEDMEVRWGQDFIARHFAREKTRLGPDDFNKAWKEHKDRAYWNDRSGDAGWRDEVPEITGPAQFPPVQRTSRATPQVVEFFMAAWADSQKGGRTHPDGTPFTVQDYFDEVIPLMKDAAKRGRESRVESHCGKSGCVCTHTDTCYRGWLEGPQYDSQKAYPCQVCRPALADVLASVPSPGNRNDGDFSKIRNHSALT